MNQASNGLENISFHSSSCYSVVREIGRGGMGIVFLAEKDTGQVLDHVVCKCLRTINPEEEKKLKQEASIATMLRHENIVKTYGMEMVPISKFPSEMQGAIKENFPETPKKDTSFFSKLGFGKTAQTERTLPLLVMDFINGTDFHTLLVNHLRNNLLFPVPLAAFVISRIASALSYAHTYIVHRDISPENILISNQGVCKLTDFGVAVVAHKQPDYWAGKLMYMAPEQIRNDPIDERADIYALGLVAYQAVTGIQLLYASPRLSFEDQVRKVYSQMETNVIPPHLVRKDIPKSLSMIITKMLSRTPEYRYQRASMVANDLEKDYLYAEGFGPTNNSLASYIDIANSNFEEYNEDHIQQLSFLKSENGQMQLRRNLSVDGYTKAGQRLLAERKGSLAFNRLKEIHKQKLKEQKQQVSAPQAPVDVKESYIKVKYLDNVGEAFALEKGPITIGRSSKNLVVLPNKTISGAHAQINQENGQVTIEDRGSHNGTTVNGTRISQKVVVNEGDKIQIGPTVLYYLKEARPTPSQSILSLSDKITVENLKDEDITFQFLPEEEMLSKVNEIVEHIIASTSVGDMKRNVLPPAVYEAVRLFSGEVSDTPMQLRVIRSGKYITFRCSSPKESLGYEAFLSAIHRRMDQSLDDKSRLLPEELAVSLILKVFDRIEAFRFSREFLMTCFF